MDCKAPTQIDVQASCANDTYHIIGNSGRIIEAIRGRRSGLRSSEDPVRDHQRWLVTAHGVNGQPRLARVVRRPARDMAGDPLADSAG